MKAEKKPRMKPQKLENIFKSGKEQRRNKSIKAKR
jgi:hypothetical protein